MVEIFDVMVMIVVHFEAAVYVVVVAGQQECSFFVS